jgi:cbb3-type cytochrome oxidase subunit 3
MNPLIHEAADSVRLGWIMAAMTVLFLSSFIFWTWWAYRGPNKARWEADSRLPFNDGGES